MTNISVKTAEGRVAYDAPRGGKKIPSDKFMQVRETPYIRRLIDHHGDLIEEGGTRRRSEQKKQDAPKLEAQPIKAS